MTKEHQKVVFANEILPPGAIVRDARFVQCSFVSCATNPAASPLVERVRFERTTLKSKRVDGVVCRDVTIDTCKNTSIFIVENCLFERVTLTGPFGRWMFCRSPEYLSPEQAARAKNFYDGVEWALDIQRAQFKELTLRGVPVDKVRRDPERQVALRKDRLHADRSWESDRFWKKLGDPGYVAVLRAALDRPDEPWVLAAGDLSKDFESDKKLLKALRGAGFAE